MQNIFPTQETLLIQLRDTDPALSIEWDDVRGVAASVRGKLSESLVVDDGPENIMKTFLNTYGKLFGPSELNNMVELMSKKTDDLGWTHLEFQMYFTFTGRKKNKERIQVYQSKLVGHFMPGNILTEVQSSCWREIDSEGFEVRLTESGLLDVLTKAVINFPGFKRMQMRMRRRGEKSFPMMQKPRLVIYWWEGRFRLAWTTYTYGLSNNQSAGAKNLELGNVFVDANTGQQFLFLPMSWHGETPDKGTGLGVTPLGGPFDWRDDLNIVRVNNSLTYRLRDKTHARDIVTYDAAINDSFNTETEIEYSLLNGTLPLSEDINGDKDWDTVADPPVVPRKDSQQPEVDLHHYVREAYEWYDALAGSRAGWDDNKYPNPPVPPQTIHCIAHAPKKKNEDGTAGCVKLSSLTSH